MIPMISLQRIKLLSLAFACILVSSHAIAQDTAPLTLDRAIAQLDSAIEDSGSIDADEAVLEAAAALSFVLDQEQIQSAAGELSLGNAYFIGGDLGRSILHYRKGLSIDPSNEVLQTNLAHARSFVEPAVPNEANSMNTKTVLLSWHHLLGRWTMWIGIMAVLAVASLLWSLRILDPKNRIPLRAPIMLGIVGLVALGLLGYDQWIASSDQGMVIVTPGTDFYSGPSVSVYQEVYNGPLGIGTEAVEIERRDGWINIRLSNAQEGWIMDGQGAYINQ